MTVRFLDGPAAGAKLGLHRVPIYLRVVIDRETGKVDALDQLDDVPRGGEDIYVYEGDRSTLSALRGDIIICVRGADGMQRAATGSGDYRYRPDLDGETFRDTAAWRAWAGAQPVEAPRSSPDPTAVESQQVRGTTVGADDPSPAAPGASGQGSFEASRRLTMSPATAGDGAGDNPNRTPAP